MSKFIASESTEDNESREISGKRGSRDEGNDNEEGILEASSTANSTTLTVVSTVPATTDQFMFTNDFKRLLVGLVTEDTLMTLRLATKAWKRVVDAFIDERVASGAMIVHDGKDISVDAAFARKAMRKFVTRVIFLLNITKVGERACMLAAKLVVVDIPEGIKSISRSAFYACTSLTTVSFPTTLTSIDHAAFNYCTSLENVVLLHTNLQKLGDHAFDSCSELKSMTIPNSLQTLGTSVFWMCSKLVPSNIGISDWPDATSEIVAHLCSKQQT